MTNYSAMTYFFLSVFWSKYGLKPKGDYDLEDYCLALDEVLVQIWTEAERRL